MEPEEAFWEKPRIKSCETVPLNWKIVPFVNASVMSVLGVVETDVAPTY